MNILLIENSEILQYKLTKYLKDTGHLVIASHSLEKAMQQSGFFNVDLIFYTIDTACFANEKAISILKGFFQERWIPIILMIKENEAQGILNENLNGADDYLIKPINQEQFNHKICFIEKVISIQEKSKKLEKKVDELFRKDKLIGIKTYNEFLEVSQLQWNILSRQHLPASILMIKIDHFNQYTEYYNEKTLRNNVQMIADKIFQSVKRPGDIVARMDDSHFIIMLTGTGKSGASCVAKSICQSVESLNAQYEKSTITKFISVSVGGAVCIRLRDQSLFKTIDLARTTLKYVNTYFGNDYKIAKFDTMKCSGVEIKKNKKKHSQIKEYLIKKTFSLHQ